MMANETVFLGCGCVNSCQGHNDQNHDINPLCTIPGCSGECYFDENGDLKIEYAEPKAPEPTGDEEATQQPGNCHYAGHPFIHFERETCLRWHPLQSPEPKAPTGDEKATPIQTLVGLLTEAGAIPVINGVRIEPKAPDVTEVVLPPLDVTVEDQKSAEQMFDGRPTSLLTTREGQDVFLLRLTAESLCRERQLKAEIEAHRESKEVKMFWFKECKKAESERDAALEALANLAVDFKKAEDQLQRDLDAMTEDRNLWQDEHNGDCPNTAKLEAVQRDLDAAREALGVLAGGFNESSAQLQRDLDAAKELLKGYKAGCAYCTEYGACVWCEGTDNLLK